MSKHLPECHRWFANMPEDWCPACEMFRACEQRVRQSAATLWDHTSEQMAAARVEGIRAGLTAAREAVAALHQRVPVIECACGWGKDCPECGSESNLIVGYACDSCCNSFGDHAYCDDLHYDDDTSLHYQDGVMWSGPHCPTMAAIDALRRESDV
jgi:hypothetical protein